MGEMGGSGRFREHLRRQLRFLESSCARYDAGDYDEGIRVAPVVRVLFHDTRRSTALLRHLDALSIRLLSTGEDIPAAAEFWPNLTDMRIDPVRQHVGFIPKLATARTRRSIAFDAWWACETVYRSRPDRLELNRRDIVLGAANQDGGAHVDTTVDAAYAAATAGLSWSMTLEVGA